MADTLREAATAESEATMRGAASYRRGSAAMAWLWSWPLAGGVDRSAGTVAGACRCTRLVQAGLQLHEALVVNKL